MLEKSFHDCILDKHAPTRKMRARNKDSSVSWIIRNIRKKIFLKVPFGKNRKTIFV